MSLAPLPESVYCIASSSHFHVVGISVSETVLDTNLRLGGTPEHRRTQIAVNYCFLLLLFVVVVNVCSVIACAHLVGGSSYSIHQFFYGLMESEPIVELHTL